MKGCPHAYHEGKEGEQRCSSIVVQDTDSVVDVSRLLTE